MTRRLLQFLSAGAAMALLAAPLHAQAIDPSLRPYVIKAVPMDYPAEARQRRITGRGVLAGNVDFKTGKVTSVRMEKTTGKKILDDAALRSFRQWQFKPHLIRKFRTPIIFDLANRT